MPSDASLDAIIAGLFDAGVEFIIVGGMADAARDLRVLGLARLITAKSRAGRLKDRAVLPVLIATLEEQKRRVDR